MIYAELVDIHRACKQFHAILFAVDINLTSSLCSFNEEQNIPNRIASLSQIINNELREIVRNDGKPLVIVEDFDFNFHGLTIDQHMTWNAHIQKISN